MPCAARFTSRSELFCWCSSPARMWRTWCWPKEQPGGDGPQSRFGFDRAVAPGPVVIFGGMAGIAVAYLLLRATAHWWPPRHSCAVADVYTEASPFDRMYLPPSATFDLHVGSSEVTHGGAWKPQTTTLSYCSAKRPSNCAGWELAAAANSATAELS